MPNLKMFKAEAALIQKIFKSVNLTPVFEVRNYRHNSVLNEYYLQIKCKEYHHIILRIINWELISINKPALNLRKVKYPLTESKLGELKRKLTLLNEVHKKLARTSIKKFMGDLLSWTSKPNNQEAISNLLKYKRIVSKYAKHEGDVFRGIVLTRAEWNELKSGKNHEYTRPSSWANNLRTAQRYAKGYSTTRMIEAGDRVGIVFKATTPKVIFNVPAFVKANPNIVALAEANIYSEHLEPGSLYEAEIIVAPITLTYKDVVWTKRY